MKTVARFFAALALLAALVVPALAQDLTEAQRAGLEARIASFDAAMRSNDIAAIMGVVPPKVIDKIAASVGATREQLFEAMQQQMNETLKTVTIVSFAMDLEAAQFLTLPDGTDYALIPTETVVDTGEAGGKIRVTSSTLGLLDGEVWYLVRVDDPQQAGIVKEVYPAFAEVEFPAGKTELVTE